MKHPWIQKTKSSKPEPPDKNTLWLACKLAYPIVAAYCNAMGEACPPDAARCLGVLHDTLGLGPDMPGAKSNGVLSKPKTKKRR